ncbi:MAG: hypothetical protein FWE23_05220 [Chitinivibrionia bacterium]|nr:hypothetical protein [Chitinivibrionia bacterium]
MGNDADTGVFTDSILVGIAVLLVGITIIMIIIMFANNITAISFPLIDDKINVNVFSVFACVHLIIVLVIIYKLSKLICKLHYKNEEKKDGFRNLNKLYKLLYNKNKKENKNENQQPTQTIGDSTIYRHKPMGIHQRRRLRRRPVRHLNARTPERGAQQLNGALSSC